MIAIDGTIRYYDDFGMYHRENGPAVICDSGSKFYYKHGKQHRTDGPAQIMDNGRFEYWIDGTKLSEDEFKLKQFFKV